MSTLERTFQKGKAEGKAEGKADILLHLLDRRFGPLDEATAALVRRGAPTDLERWADRVLSAPSLREVLAPPADA